MNYGGVPVITSNKYSPSLEMLSKNQVRVTQYKSGKEILFGYFVGEVMKISKGKANPNLVNQILKDKLK